MSLGKGTVYAVSIKKKLYTTSSTEPELVGVSDGMPKMIWTRHFMEAQAYNVHDLYFYKDNQSAKILETNRMNYVGKNSVIQCLKLHKMICPYTGNNMKNMSSSEKIPTPREHIVLEGVYCVMYTL